MNSPFLVFSDNKGNIYSHPHLRMVAEAANQFFLPKNQELIAFPKGTSFFFLEGRFPIGFNPDTGECEALKEFNGKAVYAVSCFLPPSYTRLYNPAYSLKKKKQLPLWAYTACGFYAGKFYAAALKIDRRIRQSPGFYDSRLIKREVQKILRNYPKNRLYKHLANCALNYNCLAARNMFLKRWEAPLPTAQTCNAGCIGCLSYQDSDCIASHSRIKFKPTVQEIFQVMLNHLRVAKEAIVSFGQGCEGEPLIEADNIAQAIKAVRARTNRGTINMNTNASMPKQVEKLCKSGIDSFRVSLSSVQREYYNKYFRPRRYSFSDVISSIKIAKKHKKFVSINLFVFPGFTDLASEVSALKKLIKNTNIDMIQWRNLNIDPENYREFIPKKGAKSKGILNVIRDINKTFPKVKFGYFNLPKEKFTRFVNLIK